jgi:hypothetical protein
VSWISEHELRAIRAALSRPWRATQPEAEVRRSLAWFPDERLVSWFLEGDGCEGEEVEALRLEEALSWRRQLLLRDLGSPLSSRDLFLPLVRCDAGFLIYDGAAKGVALRRTKATERYVGALETPLRLTELLEAQPPSVPERDWPDEEDDEEDEEDEEDEPATVTLASHLARLARHHEWPAAQPWQEVLQKLGSLCASPELAEWFAQLGSTTRLVFSELRGFSLPDSLIARDEIEGAASPELQAQLHHLSWMPLIELPGRHAVLYWKGRGVRLHLFRDGAWQQAPWSRSTELPEFIAAFSGWTEPALPLDERPDLIDDSLWGLADAWLGEPAERDVDSSRLAGFGEATQHALEVWFARASEVPFVDSGERAVTSEELEAGQVIAPLLEGDSVQTCAVEGRGVVLRVGETRLPWSASITRWTRSLLVAAGHRFTSGVTVTRNLVGHYRVELPLLPWELARQLERLEVDRPVVIDAEEFSISLGAEARVEVVSFTPMLVLDGPARSQLVTQLDALREPELSMLSVTFRFKPLA